MTNRKVLLLYMKFFSRLNKKKLMLSTLCGVLLLSNLSFPALAARDYKAEAEERKKIPVETNQIINWPAGPEIGAESAILIEVNTGTVLYAKNIDARLYPASITKILTALIAVEECDMNEMVTFSSDAIHSINWREDANMGINIGDSITMEQCLYGLLVGSANEVAYAIAEHISGEGNVEGFADLMNKKAKELGCTNSNFVTANGIHDENHYTSAHDMSLIAQAFFSNELLCKMSSTTNYHVPQTSTQPREDMIVWAKSKLLPGKEYEYEYLVGTKTGYTDDARQTLVSCAQKDGLKLACVILKEETPSQFTDTIELFNYGFDNFYAASVAENDMNYSIDTSNFFSTDTDFFGSSKPLLEISSDDYIVIPENVDFEEITSELTYENLEEDEIARINYSFNNIAVGSASLVPIKDTVVTFDFGTKQQIVAPTPEEEQDTVYINIKNVIIGIIAFAILLMVLFMLRSMIVNTRKYRRRSRIVKKYKNSTSQLDWRDMKPF